jgi:hypothetical protein
LALPEILCRPGFAPSFTHSCRYFSTFPAAAAS